MSDEALHNEIVSHTRELGKLNAVSLSRSKHMPLMLAKQRLLECESQGLLCRDESIDGVDW